PAEDITELTIADLSGRVLLQPEVTGKRSAEIDVSSLSKGLYIITAKGKQCVVVSKFYRQ
ncbi:MAG TPA: T9SS type A sorting domain-containing protein, partial [Cytophagaceae bacterium]